MVIRPHRRRVSSYSPCGADLRLRQMRHVLLCGHMCRTHLGRFSRFCKAHDCDQQTQTTPNAAAVAVGRVHAMLATWSNSSTHTHLTALFPGLPRRAGTRKVEPIWILLKQETVSGSGIRWAICKSAPCSRQITMPAPHCSVFIGRIPFLPPNQQHQSTEGQHSSN